MEAYVYYHNGDGGEEGGEEKVSLKRGPGEGGPAGDDPKEQGLAAERRFRLLLLLFSAFTALLAFAVFANSALVIYQVHHLSSREDTPPAIPREEDSALEGATTASPMATSSSSSSSSPPPREAATAEEDKGETECDCPAAGDPTPAAAATCPPATPPRAPEWRTHNCALSPPYDGIGPLTVSTDHGSWPEDGFCIAYNESSFVPAASSYTVAVSVKKDTAFARGFPGLMFNYVNDDNYDGFWVQTDKSHSYCLHNVDGKPSWTLSSTRGYNAGSWNTLEVSVSKDKGSAEVSLNGRKFADCPTRHPRSARGGVLVLNGFWSILQFKDFEIRPRSDG